MRFSQIIGQEDNKALLQKAIENQKVSHAYIFDGEKYSGKKMLADAFAMALLCEKKELDGCDECRSCSQVKSHNHPDIIYVTHEKINTISVSDIRSQVNNTVDIKPYASEYKIYIIDEAEKMNMEAQNALLKTLEEPPSFVRFILLTTNAASFLPTILSRCVTLQMKPVRKDKIEKFLMREYHVTDYQAKIAVAFAQGNVGKAIRLSTSSEFQEMKAGMIQLIRRLADIDMYEMSEVLMQMEQYKGEIADYIDFIMLWFRDVLLYKATMDANLVIFQEDIYLIKDLANRSSYQGIEEMINGLEKAKKRLGANVNFELTMELLLLTIKENIK